MDSVEVLHRIPPLSDPIGNGHNAKSMPAVVVETSSYQIEEGDELGIVGEVSGGLSDMVHSPSYQIRGDELDGTMRGGFDKNVKVIDDSKSGAELGSEIETSSGVTQMEIEVEIPLHVGDRSHEQALGLVESPTDPSEMDIEIAIPLDGGGATPQSIPLVSTSKEEPGILTIYNEGGMNADGIDVEVVLGETRPDEAQPELVAQGKEILARGATSPVIVVETVGLGAVDGSSKIFEVAGAQQGDQSRNLGYTLEVEAVGAGDAETLSTTVISVANDVVEAGPDQALRVNPAPEPNCDVLEDVEEVVIPEVHARREVETRAAGTPEGGQTIEVREAKYSIISEQAEGVSVIEDAPFGKITTEQTEAPAVVQEAVDGARDSLILDERGTLGEESSPAVEMETSVIQKTVKGGVIHYSDGQISVDRHLEESMVDSLGSAQSPTFGEEVLADDLLNAEGRQVSAEARSIVIELNTSFISEEIKAEDDITDAAVLLAETSQVSYEEAMDQYDLLISSEKKDNVAHTVVLPVEVYEGGVSSKSPKDGDLLMSDEINRANKDSSSAPLITSEDIPDILVEEIREERSGHGVDALIRSESSSLSVPIPISKDGEATIDSIPTEEESRAVIGELDAGNRLTSERGLDAPVARDIPTASNDLTVAAHETTEDRVDAVVGGAEEELVLEDNKRLTKINPVCTIETVVCTSESDEALVLEQVEVQEKACATFVETTKMARTTEKSSSDGKEIVQVLLPTVEETSVVPAIETGTETATEALLVRVLPPSAEEALVVPAIETRSALLETVVGIVAEKVENVTPMESEERSVSSEPLQDGFLVTAEEERVATLVNAVDTVFETSTQMESEEGTEDGRTGTPSCSQETVMMINAEETSDIVNAIPAGDNMVEKLIMVEKLMETDNVEGKEKESVQAPEVCPQVEDVRIEEEEQRNDVVMTAVHPIVEKVIESDSVDKMENRSIPAPEVSSEVVELAIEKESISNMIRAVGAIVEKDTELESKEGVTEKARVEAVEVFAEVSAQVVELALEKERIDNVVTAVDTLVEKDSDMQGAEGTAKESLETLKVFPEVVKVGIDKERIIDDVVTAVETTLENSTEMETVEARDAGKIVIEEDTEIESADTTDEASMSEAIVAVVEKVVAVGKESTVREHEAVTSDAIAESFAGEIIGRLAEECAEGTDEAVTIEAISESSMEEITAPGEEAPVASLDTVRGNDKDDDAEGQSNGALVGVGSSMENGGLRITEISGSTIVLEEYLGEMEGSLSGTVSTPPVEEGSSNLGKVDVISAVDNSVVLEEPRSAECLVVVVEENVEEESSKAPQTCSVGGRNVSSEEMALERDKKLEEGIHAEVHLRPSDKEEAKPLDLVVDSNLAADEDMGVTERAAALTSTAPAPDTVVEESADLGNPLPGDSQTVDSLVLRFIPVVDKVSSVLSVREESMVSKEISAEVDPDSQPSSVPGVERASADTSAQKDGGPGVQNCSVSSEEVVARLEAEGNRIVSEAAEVSLGMSAPKDGVSTERNAPVPLIAIEAPEIVEKVTGVITLEGDSQVKGVSELGEGASGLGLGLVMSSAEVGDSPLTNVDAKDDRSEEVSNYMGNVPSEAGGEKNEKKRGREEENVLTEEGEKTPKTAKTANGEVSLEADATINVESDDMKVDKKRTRDESQADESLKTKVVKTSSDENPLKDVKESVNMEAEKVVTIEEKESTVEEGKDSSIKRYKKRKIALFLGYCGAGYQGMQRNPGAITIEGELEEALYRAGAISESNYGEPRRIDWMRAARTDKGVSAVGQVVSSSLVIDPPGFIERVNSHLPKAIRVYGYKRVTASFNAKKLCDRRKYEYVLPVYVFDPTVHLDRESVRAQAAKESDAKMELENSEVNPIQIQVENGEAAIAIDSTDSENVGAQTVKEVGIASAKIELNGPDTEISGEGNAAMIIDCEIKKEATVADQVTQEVTVSVVKPASGEPVVEGTVSSSVTSIVTEEVLMKDTDDCSNVICKVQERASSVSVLSQSTSLLTCQESEGKSAELGSVPPVQVQQTQEAVLVVEQKATETEKVEVLSSDEVLTQEEKKKALDEKVKKSTFKFGEAEINRLNRILRSFVGSHNFHNFTARVKADDPSAQRYIVSFETEGCLSMNGLEFVRCTVVGQSFMLHQIRKMIGLAVAIMRGMAPESIIPTALRRDTKVNVPMAPELGLFLEECHYGSYNNRFSATHEEVSLKDFADEIKEFKKEFIYPHISSTEAKDSTYALWLHSINDRHFPDLVAARERDNLGKV